MAVRKAELLARGAVWALAGLSFLSCAREALLLLGRRKRRARRWPPVLTIMPLRGLERGLERNVKASLGQPYPGRRRAILVVDSESDPAYELALRACFGRRDVEVVVAGEPPRPMGGKVWALLRALGRLRGEEAVVFCDSDAEPRRGWLEALVVALNGAEAATGYRWLSTFESPLASAWNAIGFEAMTSKEHVFLWGGSMAVRRGTLDKVDIGSLWEGALADDATLTAALKRLGGRIEFVPEAVAECPFPEGGLAGTVRWAARQMFMTYHYLRPLYRASLLAALLRLAWPSLLALSFRFRPGQPFRAALFAGALSHPLRFAFRALLMERRCGRRTLTALAASAVHALLAYPAWGLMLLACLVGRGQSVEWRGRVYTLGRDGRVALVEEVGKIWGSEGEEVRATHG